MTLAGYLDRLSRAPVCGCASTSEVEPDFVDVPVSRAKRPDPVPTILAQIDLMFQALCRPGPPNLMVERLSCGPASVSELAQAARHVAVGRRPASASAAGQRPGSPRKRWGGCAPAA